MLHFNALLFPKTVTTCSSSAMYLDPNLLIVAVMEFSNGALMCKFIESLTKAMAKFNNIEENAQIC